MALVTWNCGELLLIVDKFRFATLKTGSKNDILETLENLLIIER